MSETIQIHSRVGEDGVLTLRLPLGSEDAGSEVLITIARLNGGHSSAPSATDDWREFVRQTYGSCARLGLDRHAQGEFEERETVR
jgi:hypothetical protein